MASTPPQNPLIVPNNTSSAFVNVTMGLGDLALDTTLGALRVGDGATVGGRIFADATTMIGLVTTAISPIVQRAQNAIPFSTWTALAGTNSMNGGDRAAVAATDTGTHTDPVVGGTVNNAGRYVYSTSPAGWQRVDDLDSTKAAASATAAQAAVAAFAGALQTSGTYPAVIGNHILAAGLTVYADAVVAQDGPLQGVSVYPNAAGTATLCVSNVNADGTFTRIPALDKTVTLVANAVNTFPTYNPVVSAGQRVGIYFAGSVYYTDGQTGKKTLYTTGLTGTATAVSTISNVVASVSFQAQGGEVARAKASEAFLQSEFDGAIVTGGQIPAAALTSILTANYAGMCATPITAGSIVATCNLTASTDAIAYLVTADVNLSVTGIVKAVPFTGKSGANNIYMGSQPSGLYLIVWPKSASLTYQTTGGNGARSLPVPGAPSVAVSRAGTTALNSLVITGLSTTADLSQGETIIGTGIPANSTIATIDSATQITFTNSGGTGATANGTPTLTFGGKTSSIGTTANISIGWTSTSGTSPRLNALEAQAQGSGLNGAGFGLVDTADKTGVADATAIFAAARAAHPTPNIPVGTYSLASWPYNGEGFWGPGQVLVGGVSVSLPIAPERGSRQLKMRAYLSSIIRSGACVIINGDSIGAGAFASTMAKHWATTTLRFANLGIAVDECVTGNFNDADPAGNLAFQGIVLANPSTGTLGFNGAVKSLMLQPGQSLMSYGTYERTDGTYQGVAGGQLSFGYSPAASTASSAAVLAAQTVYKTVNCASSGSDVWANAGPTGQTASGWFIVTNTGTVAVELTSWMRFGVKVANSPPRLNVCRFAHGNFKFTDYSANKAASMVRIANAVAQITNGGTNHLLITELGTNDGIAGVLYATMKANVAAYAQAFITAGLPAASMLPLMPWRWSGYPNGGSYEDELAGVRDGFKSVGVSRCIQMDGFDMIGEGYSGADGHPIDAGQLVIRDTIVTALGGGFL
jgi:hypothetical protein